MRLGSSGEFPQTSALTGLRYAPTAVRLGGHSFFALTSQGSILEKGTEWRQRAISGTQSPEQNPGLFPYLFRGEP